jgi:hypothetical protein
MNLARIQRSGTPIFIPYFCGLCLCGMWGVRSREFWLPKSFPLLPSCHPSDFSSNFGDENLVFFLIKKKHEKLVHFVAIGSKVGNKMGNS